MQDGLEELQKTEEPEDEAQMKTFKDFREEAKPVEKPSKDKAYCKSSR